MRTGRREICSRWVATAFRFDAGTISLAAERLMQSVERRPKLPITRSGWNVALRGFKMEGVSVAVSVNVDRDFARFGSKTYAINKINSIEVRRHRSSATCRALSLRRAALSNGRCAPCPAMRRDACSVYPGYSRPVV